MAGEITNPCEWEQCKEIATHRVKWRREVPQKPDTFDIADYCDGHMQMARTHGAIHVEWLDKPKVEGTRR